MKSKVSTTVSSRAALALLVITARQIAGFYRIRRAPSIEALLAENEAKLLEQSARNDTGTGAAETAFKLQYARRVSKGQASDLYHAADTPQVHPIEVEASRDSNSALVTDIED